MIGLLRAVSVDQWRAIDSETDRVEGARVSLQVAMVLVTVAVSLTIQEYVGSNETFAEWFPDDGSRYWQLWSFAWWSGWRVIGYVAMPLVVLAAMPGERLRDFHISPRGFFRHLWIYGALFLAISPVVVLASRSPSFTSMYPFYRLASRSTFDLVAWELLYAVQFVALEFFFRGFMLQGLRRAFGANAIFVMIVPYCMIHYGKPLPETFGAIGAGVILGTLAMRTRSIWGGVVIHIAVAVSMDMLALYG